MKLLRILTGLHAGAQLQLASGSHRIGSDADADIRLADWQGSDAFLNVDVEYVVCITRSVPDGEMMHDAEAGTMLLIDFVPVQFDEIVLCIGPSDLGWPSDLDLLSTLLASPVKTPSASLRQQQKQRRQLTAIAACILLGGSIIPAALLSTTHMNRAAFRTSADDRTLRVTQALAAAHITELHAQTLGNFVVVTGMVGTTNDDDAVRGLLNRVTPYGVQRRYDVAQNDVRSIQDSLGVAGTQVSYIGNGRFAINGRIADKRQLEAAVARVRSDMDANVKELDIRAIQTTDVAKKTDSPEAYSEMVSSDDVRYAQTPDGVKHIFAVDPPAMYINKPTSSPDSAFTPLPDPKSMPLTRRGAPHG